MKAAILSLLAIPAMALPDRIQYQDAQGPMDPPTQVTIERTGYSGNGCPQGSVSTLLSDDKSVVTFGFDSFQAAIGPNVNPNNKQKNCQLHLDLRYPSGFSFSVLQATYHGYVRLDDGVNANFIASYYFSQDASHTATTRSTLRGPEFANGKTYTKSDNVETSATVWSPCGANGILNVNNRIALTANSVNGTGEISNDDATLKFTQKLRITWRRCNQDDASSGSDPNYNDGSYSRSPVPAQPTAQRPPPYDDYGYGYGSSYSTYSNNGFGGFTDAASYGYPAAQVWGPNGRPWGGVSTTTTISKPVDTSMQIDSSSAPVDSSIQVDSSSVPVDSSISLQ